VYTAYVKNLSIIGSTGNGKVFLLIRPTRLMTDGDVSAVTCDHGLTWHPIPKHVFNGLSAYHHGPNQIQTMGDGSRVSNMYRVKRISLDLQHRTRQNLRLFDA
jgi:hypothetical protein